MKLTKAQREQVRMMLGGRCAYCGHDLGSRWHADHVEPVQRKLARVNGKIVATTELWRPENDHIGNMMPACAPCNIRKGGEPLESFRTGMERSIEVARAASSAYRHALRFGLIEEKPQPVIFYFERFAAQQEAA